MLVDHVTIISGKVSMTVKDDHFEVKQFDPEGKLKKGLGYIRGGYVYIYRGKETEFNKELHGIYLNKDGSYKFVEPPSDLKELYHVKNLEVFDVDKIFREMESYEEQFIDPDDIEVINRNSEFYKPTINEEDDFLKAIVKRIIAAKKINLSNLKSKFTNPYALNNLKSTLNKSTKMSVKNFKTWCEVLGVSWTMYIDDDGTDKITPLPETLEINSDEFA